MVVALGAADLAGDRPAGRLEAVHPDDRGQQGGAHDPAGAGVVAFEQRGQDAVRAVHAGQQVGDRCPDLLRVVRVRSGQRHQAGLALRDLVVAGAAALGAVVAEAGDGEDHQAGVQLVERVEAEAEPVEHAGAEVLDQDVGPPDKVEQDLPVVLGLQVEGDGLLVAVGGQEVGGLPARRRPWSRGAATNGGPQPRVSSPAPGASTLMTRAPRSPNIIVACGPASARDRSTTSVPVRGPFAAVRVVSVIVSTSLSSNRGPRTRPRRGAVRRA